MNDSHSDLAAARVRILLVDDDVAIATLLVRLLEPSGFVFTVFHDPVVGLAHLTEHVDDFEVILLDLDMPGMSGLELLAHVRELACDSPVVMWTADTTALSATTAMRAGAFSYVTKPESRADELVPLLHSAASYCRLQRHARSLERRLARVDRPPGLSPAMTALHARVDKLAQSDITTLILGESGTGKELIARSLHERGRRAGKPFIALNCGAIPESLIDSELFGHRRGAFTGAVTAHPGVFVEADGGTLFLDEIGEMPLPAQVRLLRVLQEGEIRPIGGDGVVAIDVRVVAATNENLQEAVEQKRFRADLYFRLNVVSVEVPPLRARISDVPVLAASLLRRHAGGRNVHLTSNALDALMTYLWPGNIRELENALMYALALTNGDTIDERALPKAVTSSLALRPAGASVPDDLEWAAAMSLGDAKKLAVDAFERRYTTRALERSHGNLTEAALASGLDRSNFRRVLTRLGVDPELFRS